MTGAYHRLFEIEKSFRMSKHDLAARPIYHHSRASIDAHLTIVFAALAISRFVEEATGWSIRKFVRTTRRYRPSTSASAHTCSPPKIRYPTTSARPSPHQLNGYALIWPNFGSHSGAVGFRTPRAGKSTTARARHNAQPSQSERGYSGRILRLSTPVSLPAAAPCRAENTHRSTAPRERGGCGACGERGRAAGPDGRS